jgi:activator of HSP90 ATPase
VKLCLAIAVLTPNLRSATYGRLYSRNTKAVSKSSLLVTLVTVFVLPVASAQPNKSITIHQEIDFNTSPQLLYEALLDANQFTAFSGRPAEINREVGGAFSLFGGHIIGRNVELLPNHRIVQAWRVVTWPEGVYSIAKFELKPNGSGTRLVFDHIGFPEGLHDHLAEGWTSNYWMLLKKYFH